MAKKTKSAGNSNQPARGVDLGEVERLLEFMQKHQLEQFEYEGGGVRILLKKASAQPSATSRPAASAAPMASAPVEAGAAEPVAAHEAPAKSAVKAVDADVHVVKSPIVGTFYASPSPGAEAFVTVGAKVEQGQVLCIIEAMKLMNEIEADAAGEIVEIFVENGNPVEYGEKLFGIRTKGRK